MTAHVKAEHNEKRRAALLTRPAGATVADLDTTVESAVAYMLGLQSDSGYWVFDLEADTTIPSEYVLLQRFLGRGMDPAVKARTARYIRNRQLPTGGWPLYEEGGPDLSASVKAYMALKVMGDSPDEPHMERARKEILALGGASRVNVFTRITLALFGQVPWRVTPAMPVELMVLPRWFPIHMEKVSYWSRTVIAPLLLLYSRRPVCELSPEEGVRELFREDTTELKNLDGFVEGNKRKNFFIGLDRVLKKTERLFPRSLRRVAEARAEVFTRERMAGEGGIGAIFPAMANSVMALKVLGCGPEDPDYARGLKAVDDLMVDSGDETFCQPCVSPVWDTCLALSALMEAGARPDDPSVKSAIDWLLEKQVFTRGDWTAKADPDLEGGGWAFQFENDFYPDLDDTSMVIMAMLRAGALEDPEVKERLRKAVNWVVGMQSSDGGWAAFDIDNNYLYLNDIPFADHGALLDPPTSDLTARCVELLAMLGYALDFAPVARGIEFLKREQEGFGGWFGRWGANYIYGTWSVLCGVARAGVNMEEPWVRRGVEWLKSVQNADGGWGETLESYDDPAFAGRGTSTPSQTAWALLGLMAAGEVGSEEVARGVNYLRTRQNPEGGWDEKLFTGTGFPKVFYLKYHGYSEYFPLWALSVYRNLSARGRTRQDEVTLQTPPFRLGRSD